jgi:fermentation-respiration switch protein FrsA (DUF1100 family)
VYLILMVLVFFNQRSLMYFPQPALPENVAKAILPQAQIFKVTTADGTHLKAYFVPPKDASYPIILAFHGNGSLGLYLAPSFSEAIAKGYGVLLAEYRGYSSNEGKPTETGLYQDADAYLTYLNAQYPDTKIIAYGQSLGSGVAVDLVARNPQLFIGLVLEVPFDSALNVSNKYYPYIFFKKWVLRDQYRSNEKIGAITIPKLFLLAGQDEVVGLDSGLNLFDAAKDPKTVRVYDAATHMTVFEHGAQTDLMDFLESSQNTPTK